VSDLQKALNAAPSHLPRPNPDGNFGPKTETRVREFQQDATIPPSGVDAARDRIVQIAELEWMNFGLRPADQIGPGNPRIWAHPCADKQSRLRQGGPHLSQLFGAAGANGAMGVFTISQETEKAYPGGNLIPPGEPQWCGIFCCAVYRMAGLKNSP
jgi:peptidoglycan hydrolase-like protein with peptidoglycan-binding domain